MKRLAQISDLHFGKIDPLVVEAIATDLDEFEPNLVIVTGDLTQRAKLEQFEQAQRFLKRLCCRYLVIPGNHDIAPIYRPMARLFAPYARYRHFIAQELDSVYIDDEVMVMGLNTVHPLRISEGKVSHDQIAWIVGQTVRHPGVLHVLATHHPIVSLPGRPLEHRVRRSTPLLRALEHAGVDLVLSGHLHESYSGPAAARIGSMESLLVVQASTATSTRLRGHLNAYNRIVCDGDDACIEVRIWDGKAFCTKAAARYVRRDGAWRPFAPSNEVMKRLEGSPELVASLIQP
jgi:3',5'-cyclic AMP phosphodiesterase CpdA